MKVDNAAQLPVNNVQNNFGFRTKVRQNQSNQNFDARNQKNQLRNCGKAL